MEDEAYVYVMRGKHGSIKVGFSYNPVRRLANFQSQLDKSIRILGVWAAPNAGLAEYRSHQLLEQYRCRGAEWFDCEPPVAFAAVMKAISEQNWPPFMPEKRPTDPADPIDEDGFLRGYMRDMCPTPLSYQKEWLSASGVDMLLVSSDSGNRTSYGLESTLNRLEQGDRLLIYAPHVIGDDRMVEDTLKQVADHGASIEFAKVRK